MHMQRFYIDLTFLYSLAIKRYGSISGDINAFNPEVVGPRRFDQVQEDYEMERCSFLFGSWRTRRSGCVKSLTRFLNASRYIPLSFVIQKYDGISYSLQLHRESFS